MHLDVYAAHGAFDLFMPCMTNHDQGITFFGIALRLQMYFGHQRACGIDHMQTFCSRCVAYRLRHTVRTEHRDTTIRYFSQCVDKYCTLAFEFVHHKLVVHNFMKDIHRCAVFFECTLNNLNGPRHSCTKPARLRQHDLLWRNRLNGHEHGELPHCFFATVTPTGPVPGPARRGWSLSID